MLKNINKQTVNKIINRVFLNIYLNILGVFYKHYLKIDFYVDINFFNNHVYLYFNSCSHIKPDDKDF